MEHRCHLLGPRVHPLLSLLTPSTNPIWRTHTKLPLRTQRTLPPPSTHPHHLQNFSTTSPPRAPSSSDTNSLADLDSLSTPQKPTPTFPSSRKTSANSRIDSLLSATLDLPTSARKPYQPPTESSASMLEASYKASPASQYYSDLRERSSRTPGSLSKSMNFPNRLDSSSSYQPYDPMEIGRPRRMRHSIRSEPSLGRTVEVEPERGLDFGRALRTLEIQCAVNRVRQDQQRQRFHERPGLKRKRLKSERWRRLFRESFRATVGRVKEMRRKGW